MTEYKPFEITETRWCWHCGRSHMVVRNLIDFTDQFPFVCPYCGRLCFCAGNTVKPKEE